MELLVLLLLFISNGVFAMSEMAVVSARKARLQQWADEGKPGARDALALAQEPGPFLSTIQIGITLIGITSGAFGEATIVKPLAEGLSQWSILGPYAEETAIALVVTGITIGSLIIGELVPKRLALLSPEAIASAIAKPMRWLATLSYPLVRLLSATTDGVLRLFGLSRSTEPPVTEEEIKVLMEQGMEAGVFEQHEQAMVSRVFRLDELRVSGVMTPRGEIVHLDSEEERSVNLTRIVESGHSRFPVTRGGLDRVEGIVLAKTLLEDALSGKPIDFTSRILKPLYVPHTLTVMEVVAAFKKHRQTAALVVNEFGDVIGLVTLNDVMEALVGDIATVDDEGERDIVRRDDGSWLIDGTVTVERFRDMLHIEEALPQEDDGSYHTMGGFAMLQLGRVPNVGDRFDWNGFRFEIVDMDRNRVDKLIVTPRVAPKEQGDPAAGD